MAKRKKTTKFTESDRTKYWYVDGLDPNREIRRGGCSRDRWIEIVGELLVRDAEGHLIYRAPSLVHSDGVHIIKLDTPEWKTFLREFIYYTGYRMCWEPKPKHERRQQPSLLDEAA